MNKRFCFMMCCLFALAVVLDYCLGTFEQHQFNCAWLGSLITGAASVIGDALGFFGSSHSADQSLQATRETNQQNYQIAQEQNALNAKMFNKQLDYNTEMWNKTNAYNSPAQQMARLRAAGINPYFAMGNVQAGNAQSQTAPSWSGAAGATMQAPTDSYAIKANAYSELGHSVGEAIGNMNLFEDVRGKAMDNLYKIDHHIATLNNEKQQLQNLKQETKESKARIAQIIAQTKTLNKMREQEYQRLFKGNKLLDEDINVRSAEREIKVLEKRSTELDNAYKEWFNKYSEQLGAKNIELIQHQIYATTAQTAASYAASVLSGLQSDGIKLDNQQKRELIPLLKREQELKNKQIELQNKYGDSWFQFGGRMYDRLGNKVKLGIQSVGRKFDRAMHQDAGSVWQQSKHPKRTSRW